MLVHIACIDVYTNHKIYFLNLYKLFVLYLCLPYGPAHNLDVVRARDYAMETCYERLIGAPVGALRVCINLETADCHPLIFDGSGDGSLSVFEF